MILQLEDVKIGHYMYCAHSNGYDIAIITNLMKSYNWIEGNLIETSYNFHKQYIGQPMDFLKHKAIFCDSLNDILKLRVFQ